MMKVDAYGPMSAEARTGLIAKLAEASFLMQALRLQNLLEIRANFNPNQPRVPRGQSQGGRWIRFGEGSGGSLGRTKPGLLLVGLDDDGNPPEVPETRPTNTRERNRIGRSVARYLKGLPTSRKVIILARLGWLANEAGHTIRSYFDEPRSLIELKRRAIARRPGYDIHHIVEKTPARRDGFPEVMRENIDNKVLVPRYRHWEITGSYGTINEDFGNVTPREYLRGKSWEERQSVGLFALRKFGVLAP